MPKCDTADTAKDLLIISWEQDHWCRRCFRESLKLEEDAPRKSCRKCSVVHLKVRMFEKLEGWMCFGCAKKYGEELLKKMVPVA